MSGLDSSFSSLLGNIGSGADGQRSKGAVKTSKGSDNWNASLQESSSDTARAHPHSKSGVPGTASSKTDTDKMHATEQQPLSLEDLTTADLPSREQQRKQNVDSRLGGLHHIRVAARFRPFVGEEVGPAGWQYNVEDCVVQQNTEEVAWNSVFDRLHHQPMSHGDEQGKLSRITKHQKYELDALYQPNVTTIKIFQDIVRPMLSPVFEGHNAVVACYGPTGSGKTYTMLGSDSSAGLILLTVSQMLKERSNDIAASNTQIFCQYVEIYNERMHDLLSKQPKETSKNSRATATAELQTRMAVSQEGKSNPFIEDCSFVEIQEMKQMTTILANGENSRVYGSTQANARANRSHAILRLIVRSVKSNDYKDGVGIISTGAIDLVDLAGSERVARTAATGQRLDEGKAINKSLHTFALVVQRLAEQSLRAEGSDLETSVHIPYRDSQLTKVLQATLNHSSHCAIVCCASSHGAPDVLAETHCSLRFAVDARQVKLNPVARTAMYTHVERNLSKLKAEAQKLNASSQNSTKDRGNLSPLTSSNAQGHSHAQSSALKTPSASSASSLLLSQLAATPTSLERNMQDAEIGLLELQRREIDGLKAAKSRLEEEVCKWRDRAVLKETLMANPPSQSSSQNLGMQSSDPVQSMQMNGNEDFMARPVSELLRSVCDGSLSEMNKTLAEVVNGCNAARASNIINQIQEQTGVLCDRVCAIAGRKEGALVERMANLKVKAFEKDDSEISKRQKRPSLPFEVQVSLETDKRRAHKSSVNSSVAKSNKFKPRPGDTIAQAAASAKLRSTFEQREKQLHQHIASLQLDLSAAAQNLKKAQLRADVEAQRCGQLQGKLQLAEEARDAAESRAKASKSQVSRTANVMTQQSREESDRTKVAESHLLSEINQLSNEVTQRDEIIIDLKCQLTDVRHDLSAKSKICEEQEMDISKLTTELQRLFRSARGDGHSSQSIQPVMSSAFLQNGEGQEDPTTKAVFMTKLSGKDREIAVLEQQCDYKDAQLEKLKKRLDERKLEVQSLRQERARLSERASIAEVRLKRCQQENGLLRELHPDGIPLSAPSRRQRSLSAKAR